MALFQIILKDMMCICIVSTIKMKMGDIKAIAVVFDTIFAI